MIGEAERRHRIREHDHATRLTPAERAFVAWLDANKTRDQVLADLKTNLQVAVEVELATIPIYLFGYYSIARDAASGEAIDPPLAFANKAAGIIMSIAVEEMLHMSLSANVLYAMGGTPILYGKAPSAYPTLLPYHNPVGPPGPGGDTSELCPLARFSFVQLWHYLQIEYPEKLDAPPQDSNWQTIGQLYSYVRCLLRTKWLTDADFQRAPAASAIQPTNYSPNNVDTLYPTGKFDPWQPAPPTARPGWTDSYPSGADAARFTNRADSHAGRSELLCISTRSDAIDAVDTICDQGEGYPVPNLGAGSHDDPSKGEESHYVKFLWLQAQFADYGSIEETLPAQPPPPPRQLPMISQQALDDRLLVVDFPDNPTTASYPEALQPIADFCSALFQYMLIMVETIYRVPPQDQKLFFNEGLHRSMIWVMDKYIRTMREIPLGNGQYMAPVFENVSLGERAESFAGLKKIGLAAVKAANAQAAAQPDYASVFGDIVWYVGVAIGPDAEQTGSRPLPDVGPYWRQ
ncbi:MAG TPA: ferritin-like domain-containing protein [Allosphingosinicella sp.]|jgi:hypothetical protein